MCGVLAVWYSTPSSCEGQELALTSNNAATSYICVYSHWGSKHNSPSRDKNDDGLWQAAFSNARKRYNTRLVRWTPKV